MKRIDVLKGIEQILIQKAYETGHISHRADGDWQKQADGSWIPYAGQSAQSTPQAQESTKNIEYGEITEEDLIETPEVDLYDDDQIGFSGYANNINIDNGVVDNDDLEDVANQILLDNNLEVNDENMNKARDAMLSWLDTNGYLDGDDVEEDDTEGYYGNSGGLRSTIYEGAYDTQISNIGNTEEDDYGNSVPNDEAVENVVRGIMQEWTGDTDDEDAVEAVHDGLKDAVLDRWSTIYVQKSAVRDIRSAPTTKNMGF